MDLRRAGTLLALVAALALLGLWWFLPSTEPAAGPSPKTPAAPAPIAPRPAAAPELPPPPPPEPAGPAPGSIADAHRRIAERLGLITVRCFIGEQFDDQHFTDFYYRPRVENGWFTALVEEPQGAAVLSIMHKDPDDDSMAAMLAATFEFPYQIRWSAPEGAIETGCRVEEVGTAKLYVEIEQEGGGDELFAGMPVHYSAGGCGFYASGPGPVLEGEVKVIGTEPSCELFVSSIGSSATLPLQAMVPGEERRVSVLLGAQRFPDADDVAALDEQLEDSTNHDIEVWSQEAETLAELMKELPEGSPGYEQADLMRRHRLGMVERSEERLEELDAPPKTLQEVLEDMPDGVRELLEADGIDVDALLDPDAAPQPPDAN